MANVLIVSAGVFHPPVLGRLALWRSLGGLDRFRYQRVSSMEGLVGLPLADFVAMILYFHHRSISDAALDAFKGYVAGGGGVLAIHSATASFKKAPSYFEVLGGRFTGHGPVQSFQVKPVDSDDDLFQGIGPFVVKDELYLHALQPELRVHFKADHGGQDVPVVWTRTFGDGRVCYACPGHRSSAMKTPEYVDVLIRGLRWVAKEA